MAYYIIDLWQEENIWSWACFADSEEEAQQQALLNLNQNWNRNYADWDELAADMDGTAIQIEDPFQAMAKAAALNMVDVLKFYAGWGVTNPAYDDIVREDGGDKARAIIAQITTTPEWSGSQDPEDPDNAWIDDETGEKVDAWTGERTPGAPS